MVAAAGGRLGRRQRPRSGHVAGNSVKFGVMTQILKKFGLLHLTLGLFLIPISANAETAMEVALYCRAVIDAAQRPNTFEAGFCSGTFGAVQDISRIQWGNGVTALGFCPPPDSTRRQFVMIFLKYVDDHPEQAHLPFTSVVFPAFRQAFPCQKQ
jgi:Rap1a immunity proteins